MDFLKPVLVRIHPEGYPFITLFAVIGIGLGMIWAPLLFVGIILTAWCVYFFRDPERVTPVSEGLVISPADGVVQSIVQAEPPVELEMAAKPVWRVAIFMNVFDVHINRAPIDGTVTKMEYRPGKFLNASLDKASTDNERQGFCIETKEGAQFGVVQIAGLVARRIIADVDPGDEIIAGQRIGLIRFGSRVDVYLPEGILPTVCTGQRMIAGETVLAELATATKSKPRSKKAAADPANLRRGAIR